MDILGLGSVTIDEFLFVDTYPIADTKMPIVSRERQVGGLIATALVTTARLGCSSAYAGVLGHNDLSKAVADSLHAQGIDLSYAVWRADALPIAAWVIVAKDPPSRTILFETAGMCGADPSQPDESVILSARALLVDNWGVPGTIRATRIARQANIPVIADFEFNTAPGFPELLGLVDHLIVSARFGEKLTGEIDPAILARKLWTPQRKVVVITCGAEGAWYVTDQDDQPRHQPAFQVNTVDSTGCGDVFHGAYAAMLIRGADVATRLRFAAAASAIKATQPGGQKGIPTWKAVEEFLRQRG